MTTTPDPEKTQAPLDKAIEIATRVVEVSLFLFLSLWAYGPGQTWLIDEAHLTESHAAFMTLMFIGLLGSAVIIHENARRQMHAQLQEDESE